MSILDQIEEQQQAAQDEAEKQAEWDRLAPLVGEILAKPILERWELIRRADNLTRREKLAWTVLKGATNNWERAFDSRARAEAELSEFDAAHPELAALLAAEAGMELAKGVG